MSYQFKPEGIAVFGRGIEKGWVVDGRTGEKTYQWRPTSMLEKTGERGSHTGERVLGLDQLDEADDSVLIGGCNANVLAATYLLRKFPDVNFLAFAAGRPAYLKNEPAGLSEGTVMAERFFRKAARFDDRFRGLGIDSFEDLRGYKFIGLPGLNIFIEDKNTATNQDIEQTLDLAYQNRIKRLQMITIGVHAPRSKLMLDEVLRLRLELANIDTQLVDSDYLIQELAPQFHRDGESAKRKFGAVFKKADNSSAFTRTCVNEMFGQRKVLRGAANGERYTSYNQNPK